MSMTSPRSSDCFYVLHARLLCDVAVSLWDGVSAVIMGWFVCLFSFRSVTSNNLSLGFYRC